MERRVGSGVRVASAIPGRVRLRAVDAGGKAKLTSVADEVGTWSEVTSVDVRPRATSVVLRFDAAQASAVADRLLSLGVDLRGSAAPPRPRGAAAAVSAAATAGNRAVGQRLDGTDLRVLVPVGLGLLAARRAMRGDERLADAPWYVLAWYATETFWKLHGRDPASAGPGAGSEET